MDYITLEELKAALRLTDEVDDVLLQTAVTAASRFVDGHCDRNFTVADNTAEARRYSPAGRFETLLIDDCVQVDEVAIDVDLDGTFAEVLDPDDFEAQPVNRGAGALELPFTRLLPVEDGYWPQTIRRQRATVRVTGRFGWPAIPDAVRQATVLQASRLFTRFDSPLGVAGFGDMGAMRVSGRADPDVQMLLAPFRRLRP